jgi:flavin-dependent dehydrogenase
MSSVSVAIVGAGISGLVCARNLLNKFQFANEQLSVTLFDKAAKPG